SRDEEIALHRAQRGDLKLPFAAGIAQRPMIGDGLRLRGERHESYFAADAVCRADPPDKHKILRIGREGAVVRHRQAAGASSLAAPALAAAAAARSCAFFFGCAFSGLFCASRFRTPRPSSKRATRSVGCAPFAIQALAFSV